MKTSDVLNGAADLIEKHGHHKRSYVSADGALCALGAMRLVANGKIEPCSYTTSKLTVSGFDYYLTDFARERLAKYLRDNGDFDDRSDSITAWNDRSDKDTVVLAMREAAKIEAAREASYA